MVGRSYFPGRPRTLTLKILAVCFTCREVEWRCTSSMSPRPHEHFQRVAGLRFLMRRCVGMHRTAACAQCARNAQAACVYHSVHFITRHCFCLLLKVAANGTHQCDSLEFLRGLLGPSNQRDAMSLVACAGLWCYVA